jgi:hypothetical protein
MKLPDAYLKVYDILKAGSPPQLPVHPGDITRAQPIGPCLIVGMPESQRSTGVCSWEFDISVTVLAGSADNDWMLPLLHGTQMAAQILIAGGVGVVDVVPTTLDTGGPNPLPAYDIRCTVAG